LNKKRSDNNNNHTNSNQHQHELKKSIILRRDSLENRIDLWTRETAKSDTIKADSGQDTSHAIPRASTKYGCELKSQWLDPDNNPIPPSKTQSEYHHKMKNINLPHISYDIDGDGSVGGDDLMMAKKFDVDGNGFLDPTEQQIGKQMIAERFFKNHPQKDGDLHLFGDNFLGKTLQQNVNDLSGGSNQAFKQRLQELKCQERDLANKSGKDVKAALTVWNLDLIKNNYFTDKFNTTAWNDFGAPGPRDPNFHLQESHHGSLDTLKNLRKNKDRFYCQTMLNAAKGRELARNPWMTGSYYKSGGATAARGSLFGVTAAGPPKAANVGRSAYITNPRIENTVRLS
jgi:hypothetical protein